MSTAKTLRKGQAVQKSVASPMYGDAIANVGIYVVDGEVEALLSGNASEALGIITFHGKGRIRRSEAQEAQDADNQVYISKYPQIFSGVGTFPDYVCKYYVDPEVPPVACPPRSPPYHLEALLDKEIEMMEDAGIVEDHEGPAHGYPILCSPLKTMGE